MSLTLLHINTGPLEDAVSALGGVYEHSPWVMQRALALRPFASLAQLKVALAHVVAQATPEEQLTLLRAHPELAGKAMLQAKLTAESTNEQNRAGLTHCTALELETIQQLNRDYNARFDFPFILAVRGPRGMGLSRQDIIATFARRLQGHPDFEREECLRNVHRIAEIRLTDLFDAQPEEGHAVWDWHEALARYSEPAFAAQQQLTVTYLTEAHRQCSALLTQQMRDCGFDDVRQDAVGNVVGRYECDSWSLNENGGYSPKSSKILLTGSHFDTVRNGGKYDGRLGIYVPMAVVQALHRQGRRLPFALEVVAFSEEEGQRYKASFLSSSALTGHFQNTWLDQQDSEGITLRDALRNAGLDPANIPALQRDPAQYLGFVEVHIEQGPVLNALNLPLGVVTSINASSRYQVEIVGMASHAGTTPMGQRRDAATAAAELMLYIEQRASADSGCVGTVGMLQVPGGSVNVVPGRCHFSLDLRAPDDAQRDHLVADVLAELDALCATRGLRYTLTETMKASAAPSHPKWQARWEAAVQHLGLPVHRMPSGAGHDAMQMHKRMPQAMLFVRGENSGISHNPLESTTSHDIQLAIDAFRHLVERLATEA